jgi:hypothetical protein
MTQENEEFVDISEGMLNSICEDVLAARNLLNRMLEKAARNGIEVNVTLITGTSVVGTAIGTRVKHHDVNDVPYSQLINAANLLLNTMIELAVSRKIKIETRLIPIIHLNPGKNGLREHIAVEALPKREF